LSPLTNFQSIASAGNISRHDMTTLKMKVFVTALLVLHK
jgi:hypothetical protein